MARATKVLHAQKDYPEHDIKKGDTYWHWKFRFGTKRFSKTPPCRSQLTQSSFLSEWYDLEDEINAMGSIDESEAEDIRNGLETMRDQCEESLSNMPEQLQDSESGNILQERVDGLQKFIDAIEGIDWSLVVPEDEQEERAEQESMSTSDYMTPEVALEEILGSMPSF